jgi:hypothetical protein
VEGVSPLQNARVLQAALVPCLALVAVLIFFLGRANSRVEHLEHGVAGLEAVKRPKGTLDEALAKKDPAVARGIYLAYLRKIWPDADGFERKPDPDRFEVTKRGDLVGLAKLFVGDIECDVCRDVEMFIGLDLEGRILGFSLVKDIDQGTPDEFLARYVGKRNADGPALEREWRPISGATKTSSRILEGVIETLRELEPCRPKR